MRKSHLKIEVWGRYLIDIFDLVVGPSNLYKNGPSATNLVQGTVIFHLDGYSPLSHDLSTSVHSTHPIPDHSLHGSECEHCTWKSHHVTFRVLLFHLNKAQAVYQAL